MNRLRLAVRIAGVLGLLLALVPLHYIWRLFRAPSPWPRRFLRSAAWVCGLRIATMGRPPRRDVFVIANHCSWLDILVLGGAVGCAFVAKAELRATPLVGRLARMNRSVFVDRADRRAIPGQIAAIREALHDGPVAIFPEGTTSDGTVLLPFKPALLQVLAGAPPGMLVQPLFLDYGPLFPEIAWGQEDGRPNAARLLGRRGVIPVKLHCLDAFAPGEFGDRKAVAAEARRRIGDAIRTSGAPLRVA